VSRAGSACDWRAVHTSSAIALCLALTLAGARPLAARAAAAGDSALPAGLARDLAGIGRAPAPVGQRLVRAALALEVAGWQADSLWLRGGEIVLAGARPLPLRLAAVEGPAAGRPWQAGSAAAGPGALLAAGADWLAALDAAGYPFAQLWLEPAAAGGDTLAVSALLTPGPSGPLGELRVTGGRRLDGAFLAEVADLPREGPLGRALARRGRERLVASGWFLRVAEPELGWDPVAGRVGVLYRVEERPRPNRVTALIGGGGGATSGALDVDIFSPFGRGHHWQLGGDWQGRERSRVDLLLSAPRVLGSDLAVDLALNRAKQDSTFLQLAVQLDLRLPLPAGWEGIAGIGYERSLFGLGAGSADDASASRRRHRFGLAWRSVGGALGVAEQRRLRLIGDLLLKRSQLAGEAPSSRQFALSGNGQYGWSPAARWRLRLRGSGSLLHTARGGFNAAELAPLGGATSLRGYDEEHFRGDGVACLSGELALGDPLEVFAFLDYGWGRWRRPAGSTLSFRGWGTGLGLLAPGPRGQLALALALGESKRLGDLRVHLSLNTGF